MRLLEHKVPPPLVSLVCGGAMWLMAPGSTPPEIPATVTLVTAGSLAVAGIFVMLAGVVSFRQAETTINPLKPHSASALVTIGVYRYTRNPMYLGMLAVLMAWAIYLSTPLTVVGVLAFWLYIGRFQIRPEERALTARFGAGFVEYASRVRRWL